jgi:Zn-dependent peptidase ImmA (M78 family)
MPDLALPDPARAAAITRSALGLDPEAPVAELVWTLERGGVLVLSLPVAGGRHDAYSFWGGPMLDVPVIVLFRDVPGDRLRFSVAHELGHLVLHRAPTPNAEREAFDFASNFLVPSEAIEREFPLPLTLTDVARLKPRWGVAMQAVVMAAGRAGAINERQKRQLFQQIARRGWRKREPLSEAVPLEWPTGLTRMVELLYGEPINPRQVASDSGIPGRLVSALLDRDVVLMTLGDPTPVSEERSELATVLPLKR